MEDLNGPIWPVIAIGILCFALFTCFAIYRLCKPCNKARSNAHQTFHTSQSRQARRVNNYYRSNDHEDWPIAPAVNVYSYDTDVYNRHVEDSFIGNHHSGGHGNSHFDSGHYNDRDNCHDSGGDKGCCDNDTRCDTSGGDTGGGCDSGGGDTGGCDSGGGDSGGCDSGGGCDD